MSHKYVPSGVYLVCDKGAGMGTLTATHDAGVTTHGEPLATDGDLLPLRNVSSCGACSVLQSACVPVPVQWQQVKVDTVVGFTEWHPLLDCSTLTCGVGGQVRIMFTQADAAAAVDAQNLHAAADAAKTASLWSFVGGVACAALGVACCLTGVGAVAAPFLFAASEVLFDASAVTFEAGIGLDAAALAVEPNLPNLGLVVVDALTLGAGKLLGKAVARYAPAVAKAAGDLLQKFDPETVYHFKSNAYVQSLLDEINPKFFGKNTRYGAGFYVAERGETAIAEVTYHGGDPAAGKVIRYEMDTSRLKVLDMSDPATAKAYGADAAFAHEQAVEAEVAAKQGILTQDELQQLTDTKYAGFQDIGTRAQQEGYNAVKFPSVRGTGNNYVIYSDDAAFMNQVMKPQMVMPATK